MHGAKGFALSRLYWCIMINAAAALTPAEPDMLRLRRLRAGVEISLLFAAVALLFRDSLQSMASVWLTSSIYHHGVVVAPVSAWLILRRKDWRQAPPAADYVGVLILAAACAIELVARAAGVDLISHAAFVTAIIGVIVFHFGRQLAAQWSFPLAFLFFMVPFGEELTPALQHWAAVALAAALDVSGVETLRDGFMLTTSAGRFEVAASCAGLRFLLAAGMISSLAAYLAFEHWRTRAAFIALALIAAIFANWLRAYLIVLIATVTGRRIGVGPEHVMLGWVFYSLLIIVMLAVARRFQDRGPEPDDAHAVSAISGRTSSSALAIAIAAVAITSLYDGLVVSAKNPAAPPTAIPPITAEGFAPIADDEMWRAHAPNADLTANGKYISPDGAIRVSMAYFTHDRRGAEMAGAHTRPADGVNWRRTAISTETISYDRRSYRIAVETLEDAAGRKLDVAALYWLGEKVHGSPTALKVDVAARKLTGKPTEGGVIFVAADHDADDDPHAAIKRFFAATEAIGVWRSTFDERN